MLIYSHLFEDDEVAVAPNSESGAVTDEVLEEDASGRCHSKDESGVER